MKKIGFTMMVVAALGSRSGAADYAMEPDLAQGSVVKIVQVGRDALAAAAGARSLRRW